MLNPKFGPKNAEVNKVDYREEELKPGGHGIALDPLIFTFFLVVSPPQVVIRAHNHFEIRCRDKVVPDPTGKGRYLWCVEDKETKEVTNS